MKHFSNDPIIFDFVQMCLIERLNPNPLFKINTKKGLIYKRHPAGKGKFKYLIYGWNKHEYKVIKYKYKILMAHRIIRLYYEALNPKEATFKPNYTIDHLNRKHSDNRASNLRFVPQKVNNRSANRTGKPFIRGKKIPWSAIVKIRKEYKSGKYTQEMLSKKYSIDRRYIFDIIHNLVRKTQFRNFNQPKYSKKAMISIKTAKAILRQLKKGEFQVDVAKKFKVTRAVVVRIANNKSYNGVKL